ncbi:hypothetical protein [Streptomyces sp. NRRL WC-3742]|uniref:hypothetical protein n=1 Tax=Streptomyces sp. NRRL WC-3742 TaxID=1463934 RepID=UPI000A58D057|nr:hypothetical protein [Streptomyces sp. NRRL WC-3742]
MTKLMIKARATDHLRGTAAELQPAPRWVEVAARAAALTAVPSGVWRTLFGFGVPVGFSGATLDAFAEHQPGWGTVYCVVLSALAETLAFLTMGLVRPWGQVVPRWIPVLGGRRVHPLAAIVPALAGSVILTALGALALLGGWAHNMADPDSPHGLGGVVMTLAYLPLVFWGPLLGIVAIDYARRARRRLQQR